ncbi:MAG: type IV pilus assembly protein PilM [Fimbriimonadaceae bacterium]|nr:type IV pilus assembly protein PilM [Fimbriimonadaceae bacterium]
MAKKYTSIVGVDIGSQTIKVAEVKLAGKQPTITALGMAMTPEGAVDHVGVHDSVVVGDVLKQVCAQAGVSVGDAVVSLSGQGSVVVRTLEVPVMSDAELKQHMEWEITRNIPFAESDVVSDFASFPANGAQNMDVVMAIATQSTVNTIRDILKRAGKKPAALDVQPLGLARVLRTGYEVELANKRVCIVDIGHKSSSISIFNDGKLVMPRQVPIGGEMFTRAIADGLAVPFAEAEAMKHAKGRIPETAGQAPTFNPFGDSGFATQQFQPYNPFADADEAAPAAPAAEEAPQAPAAPVASGLDPEETKLWNAMAAVADEFVSEVRRSIDYFRSKGGDVDSVMLCGGGARLKGVAEFVQSVIGVPTALFDPTRGLPVTAKHADDLQQEKQDFAVAIGNGLHIAF